MKTRKTVLLPSVTLIIPQYDQPEYTIAAVRTLRESDKIRWPIVIVDNGSSAQSLRQLHDLADDATEVITLAEPGLTAAWNRAASRTRSEFLVFLNNDTRSTGPWVEKLLEPLISDRAIVSGAEVRREITLGHPIELLAGWCLALRLTSFQQLGGFDESLQLYFSDTDLLLRADKFSSALDVRGWEYVPDLPLMHLRHRTTHSLGDHRRAWSADRARFHASWRGKH